MTMHAALARGRQDELHLDSMVALVTQNFESLGIIAGAEVLVSLRGKAPVEIVIVKE